MCIKITMNILRLGLQNVPHAYLFVWGHSESVLTYCFAWSIFCFWQILHSSHRQASRQHGKERGQMKMTFSQSQLWKKKIQVASSGIFVTAQKKSLDKIMPAIYLDISHCVTDVHLHFFSLFFFFLGGGGSDKKGQGWMFSTEPTEYFTLSWCSSH